MAFLYLIMQVGMALHGRWLFRSWLNPLGVYAAVLSLAVIVNRALPLARPSLATWLILFGAALAFYTGALIGAGASAWPRAWGGRPTLRRRRDDLKICHRLAAFVIAILLAYLLVFALINASHLMAVVPEGIRAVYALYASYYSGRIFHVSYVEGLVLLAALSTGLADGGSRRTHRKTLAVATVASGFAFITATLTVFFASAAIYAFSRTLMSSSSVALSQASRDRGAKRRWRSGNALAGLVVLTALTITTGRILVGAADIGWQLGRAPTVEALALRLGGSVSRLEVAVARQERNQLPSGALTLGPILRQVCRVQGSAERCDDLFPRVQPFATTPLVWNTGTYLMDLWFDFGWLGITLGPLFLGLVSSLLWARAAKTGRVGLVAAASFSMAVISFAFHFTLTFSGVLWVAIAGWLFSYGIRALWLEWSRVGSRVAAPAR